MRSALELDLYRGLKTINVHKAILIFTFLCLNIIITHRILLSTFFIQAELILETIYLVVLFFYLLGRIIKRLFNGNLTVNTLELFLMLFMLLPIWGGIASYKAYGQPLMFGFLTFRDFYLIVGSLFVYNLLRENKITIKMVEEAFVAVAWFSLIFFYVSTIFTDPSRYQDTGIAGFNLAKGGDVYYRFNMVFMFFGSVYYCVKAFYKRNIIYLAFGALFLFYIVAIRLDRTSIVVVLAALGAFFVTALSVKYQVISFLRFAFPITAVVISLLFLFPDQLANYERMFGDVFKTITGQANQNLQKVSIRLYELDIALEGIRENPIQGNGKVSKRWVEGGFNFFHKFFYPSDLGFIGQIFLYGYIGAFLIYSQFLFALYHIFKIKTIKKNIFLVTLKFYLLALFLDSLTNGYLTNYAAHAMTVVILIYFFYQKDRQLQLQNKEFIID